MKTTFIHLLTALAICLALLAPIPAQSQTMYSWTDENGVVHFSDTKPAGQAVEEQAIPAGPQTHGVGSGTPPEESAGSSVAQQRREEIAHNNDEARANQAMNSAQCASWQSEVDRLEPHRRVFFTNDKGEVERMDDVERANRVAELKQQIAANCN